MKASGSVIAPVLGVLVPLLALGLVSCKEDEAPPPLPSAAPVAVAPEQTVLTIQEEDAAVDVAEDVKKTGGGRPSNSLSACCAALTQNAANAPEPNAGFLRSAATLCNGAAAAGKTSGSVLPQVRAALQGMNMPAGCQ